MSVAALKRTAKKEPDKQRRDHLNRLIAGPDAIRHLTEKDQTKLEKRQKLNADVSAIGKRNRAKAIAAGKKQAAKEAQAQAAASAKAAQVQAEAARDAEAIVEEQSQMDELKAEVARLEAENKALKKAG